MAVGCTVARMRMLSMLRKPCHLPTVSAEGIPQHPLFVMKSINPFLSLLISVVSPAHCWLLKFQVGRWWWVRLHYPTGLSGAGPGSALLPHRLGELMRRCDRGGVREDTVGAPHALGRCRSILVESLVAIAVWGQVRITYLRKHRTTCFSSLAVCCSTS